MSRATLDAQVLVIRQGSEAIRGSSLGASRATLVRDLRGILLRFVSISGEGSTVGAPMSRATLGAEASDVMDDSGGKLATPSRGSQGVRRRP
jgi:hypothetical protein